jgi:hypothetical protein
MVMMMAVTMIVAMSFVIVTRMSVMVMMTLIMG